MDTSSTVSLHVSLTTTDSSLHFLFSRKTDGHCEWRHYTIALTNHLEHCVHLWGTHRTRYMHLQEPKITYFPSSQIASQCFNFFQPLNRLLFFFFCLLAFWLVSEANLSATCITYQHLASGQCISVVTDTHTCTVIFHYLPRSLRANTSKKPSPERMYCSLIAPNSSWPAVSKTDTHTHTHTKQIKQPAMARDARDN